MESPDEYLGRLNFLGFRGVKGRRGALLHRRGDGRSVIVYVCVHACAPRACLCRVRPRIRTLSPSPGAHTHRAVPIDFVSVSLYCNFISVVSADGGAGEEGVFVYWL